MGDNDYIPISERIKQEGEVKNRISQICKKLVKNKSIETIADEIEESVEFVDCVVEIAKKYDPDYDVDKILEEYLTNFGFGVNSL